MSETTKGSGGGGGESVLPYIVGNFDIKKIVEDPIDIVDKPVRFIGGLGIAGGGLMIIPDMINDAGRKGKGGGGVEKPAAPTKPAKKGN